GQSIKISVDSLILPFFTFALKVCQQVINEGDEIISRPDTLYTRSPIHIYSPNRSTYVIFCQSWRRRGQREQVEHWRSQNIDRKPHVLGYKVPREILCLFFGGHYEWNVYTSQARRE